LITTKFYKALDEYRARLDKYTDEQFMQTPPNGGWSCAEVYAHLLRSNLLSAMAADRCSRAADKKTAGKPNLLGKLVLLFGQLPPVRVKAPAEVNSKAPAEKITKEEAKNLIVKNRARAAELADLIENGTTNRRMKHPRLGMLNAPEWYKFMLIHTKHHTKQLNRIEKSLR